MEKKEEAIKSFESGHNCAQSVLSAFTESYGFDRHLAFSISSGFGAGMGRLQECCGALTGAFMVIGIHNNHHLSDSKRSKEASVAMIQQFTKAFQNSRGPTKCKDLIGCDLNTQEGQATFAKQNLGKKVCIPCIEQSVSILENLLLQP